MVGDDASEKIAQLQRWSVLGRPTTKLELRGYRGHDSSLGAKASEYSFEHIRVRTELCHVFARLPSFSKGKR